MKDVAPVIIGGLLLAFACVGATIVCNDDSSYLPLRLWDADSDVVVADPLPQTIDLCNYGAAGLTIEVVAPNCIDKIKFKLLNADSDAIVFKNTEGRPPFMMGGDVGVDQEDVLSVGQLQVHGNYSLEINPQPGTKQDVSFEVVACPQCFDFPGFYDSFGRTCDDYADEAFDCAEITDDYFDAGFGYAADACCICGGGTSMPPPTSSPTATPGPSTVCFDIPGYRSGPLSWTCDDFRAAGFDCTGFDSPTFATEDGTPADACCFCGGGTTTAPPTMEPTTTPYPSAGCFDEPGFFDSFGRTCDDYVAEPFDCADLDDDYFNGGLGLPSDACCICGGGSLEPPPTMSPSVTAGPSSECYDLLGEFDLPLTFGPIALTCDDFRDGGFVCSEYTFVFDTIDASDACCYCGGGSPTPV